MFSKLNSLLLSLVPKVLFPGDSVLSERRIRWKFNKPCEITNGTSNERYFSLLFYKALSVLFKYLRWYIKNICSSNF